MTASSQKWKSWCAVFLVALPGNAGTHQRLRMTELASESKFPKAKTGSSLFTMNLLS